ncbi:unnamed protein product, partial [Caenorhabditis brenneri]
MEEEASVSIDQIDNQTKQPITRHSTQSSAYEKHQGSRYKGVQSKQCGLLKSTQLIRKIPQTTIYSCLDPRK